MIAWLKELWRLKRPTLRPIVKALLLVVLGFLIHHYLTLDHLLQEKAWSFWGGWNQPGTEMSSLTIIRLNDRSIADRTERVPFPRDVLARVIDVAAQARPRAIYLDIFLEQTTAADAALLRAISNAPVYLAQDFRADRHRVEPVPVLANFAAAARGHGLSAYELDHDLVVRSSRLSFRSGHEAPQFALPAVIAAHLRAWPEAELGKRLPAKLPLHFAAPPEKLFHYLDADQLLNPTPANAALLPLALNSNSVVIIGPFHQASRDFFNVPLIAGDEQGTRRGAELLAYTLHGLLSPTMPSYAASWKIWLVALALLGLGWYVWQTHAGRWWFIAFWLAPLVYSAWCFWLVRDGSYWSLSKPIIAWLFGWHFGHTLREEQQHAVGQHGRH